MGVQEKRKHCDGGSVTFNARKELSLGCCHHNVCVPVVESVQVVDTCAVDIFCCEYSDKIFVLEE